MKFPQLCHQFKDLLAFSVAEFDFDKNQNKPCLKSKSPLFNQTTKGLCKSVLSSLY